MQPLLVCVWPSFSMAQRRPRLARPWQLLYTTVTVDTYGYLQSLTVLRSCCCCCYCRCSAGGGRRYGLGHLLRILATLLRRSVALAMTEGGGRTGHRWARTSPLNSAMPTLILAAELKLYSRPIRLRINNRWHAPDRIQQKETWHFYWPSIACRHDADDTQLLSCGFLK